MSRPSEEYRAQAAAAQARADAAKLGNVREREMAAVDAWTRMAEQAERVEAVREERSGR